MLEDLFDYEELINADIIIVSRTIWNVAYDDSCSGDALILGKLASSQLQ